MEKNNTKQAIIDAAFELFSENGFEATSISQIVDKVGIKKASLYFHFDSKQAIFDTILDDVGEQYRENSYVGELDLNNDVEVRAHFGDLSVEDITDKVKGQIKYVIHDSQVRMTRKMLHIEQFKNAEIAKALTERTYTAILNYNKQLMNILIARNILQKYDVEMMTAQFALPVSAWIDLCDREPEREEEVMNLIERHVKQFFEVYGVK